MTCTLRHILVSGANSGIGLATARAAAENGWHVFAAARNPEGLADTIAGRSEGLATEVVLDVTKPSDIAALRSVVAEHVAGAGLDALANVAGIGVSAPLETVEIERVRAIFEVNVIGQLALTQAIVPLVREAKGRIVMVGSVGDRLTVPFAGPLTASKWAIAAMTETLRQELAPWGIRVVLVEPASIRTPAVDKMRAEVDQTLAEFTPEQQVLYGSTYRSVLSNFLAKEDNGSPPEVVAETIMKALADAHPRARYLTGADAHRLAALAHLPSTAQDAAKRKVFGLPKPGSAD